MAASWTSGYSRRSGSVFYLISSAQHLRPARLDATDSVVRCEPGEDATNGFFVACFERNSSKKRKAEHDEDSHDGTLGVTNISGHDQSPAKKKRKKKKKKSKPVGAPEVTGPGSTLC